VDRAVSAIHELGGNLHTALENVSVPSYVVDSTGVIRWINPAAERLVGNVVGRQNTSVVAPEETRRTRESFARKRAGTEKVTDEGVVLIGADGRRIQVELSAVAMMEGHRMIGVFGQIADVEEEAMHAPPPHLTPRQVEVLRLLQRGASTDRIASELHLSAATVRNHIRHLLSALGVHTRIEAVAAASSGFA